MATNFAYKSPERKGGASCDSNTGEQGSNTQTSAGRTTYQKYEIDFDADGNAFIDVRDYTWSNSENITLDDGTVVNNIIKAGHAGDCFSWNKCDVNKRGSFSVNLTGTALAFDSHLEWGNPDNMVGQFYLCLY